MARTAGSFLVSDADAGEVVAKYAEQTGTSKSEAAALLIGIAKAAVNAVRKAAPAKQAEAAKPEAPKAEEKPKKKPAAPEEPRKGRRIECAGGCGAWWYYGGKGRPKRWCDRCYHKQKSLTNHGVGEAAPPIGRKPRKPKTEVAQAEAPKGETLPVVGAAVAEAEAV